MKTPFVIVLGLLLVIGPCYARIGETEAQIEKRYGDPIDSFKNPFGKKSRYFFSGYIIFVDFERGVSAMETYTKKDGSVIQPTEVVSLLAANSGGASWTDPELVDGQYVSHTRKAPKRVALYNPFTRDLMITTKEALDRAASAINAAARKKMEGF